MNNWNIRNALLSNELNDLDGDSDEFELDDADHPSDENELPEDEVTEEEQCKRAEDEENYIKFVQSVFCDDDDTAGNSFGEEDDEEYNPDEVVEADQEDDEEEDEELVKVQRKELRELVNECWQTLADENSTHANKFSVPLHFDATENYDERSVSTLNNGGLSYGESDVPFGSADETASDRRKIANTGQSVIASLVSQIFSGGKPSELCVEGMPVDAIRKLVARQMSMATQLLVQLLLQADEKSECFTSGYTSLMELSNLRESALKKAMLVRMNVKTATAVQSLQSEHGRSHKAPKAAVNTAADASKILALLPIPVVPSDSMMRIGSSHLGKMNHSIVACPPMHSGFGVPMTVKSQLQVNHAAMPVAQRGVPQAAGASSHRPMANGARGTKNAIHVPEVPQVQPDEDAEVVERRLTRSVAASHNLEGEEDVKGLSVFDIPALKQVSALFEMVDVARRDIKEQLAATASSTAGSLLARMQAEKAKKNAASSNSNSNGSAPSLKSIGTEDGQQRTRLLSLSKQHIRKIMGKMGMRAWNSLIPTANYPLEESLVLNTAPTSITGRTLFTPAEDDLLLRGIFTLGENNWSKVKMLFLPAKEAQLLQYRFSQMTSLAATSENIFKRYQKLEIEYRNRDVKWTHEEDLDLLRGYQTFGEKWPLISIFYLPHRKRKEIRQRWQSLQKLWAKGFAPHQSRGAAYTSLLTDHVRYFLHILNGHEVAPFTLPMPPMMEMDDDYAVGEAQREVSLPASSGIPHTQENIAAIRSVGMVSPSKRKREYLNSSSKAQRRDDSPVKGVNHINSGLPSSSSSSSRTSPPVTSSAPAMVNDISNLVKKKDPSRSNRAMASAPAAVVEEKSMLSSLVDMFDGSISHLAAHKGAALPLMDSMDTNFSNMTQMLNQLREEQQAKTEAPAPAANTAAEKHAPGEKAPEFSQLLASKRGSNSAAKESSPTGMLLSPGKTGNGRSLLAVHDEFSVNFSNFTQMLGSLKSQIGGEERDQAQAPQHHAEIPLTIRSAAPAIAGSSGAVPSDHSNNSGGKKRKVAGKGPKNAQQDGGFGANFKNVFDENSLQAAQSGNNNSAKKRRKTAAGAASAEGGGDSDLMKECMLEDINTNLSDITQMLQSLKEGNMEAKAASNSQLSQHIKKRRADSSSTMEGERKATPTSGLFAMVMASANTTGK